MVRSTRPSSPITRGEWPRAVYRQLREQIVRGRLAPGSPLIETELADRLRLSRTPVRSALQRLHQEGLILEAGGARLFKYVVAPLTRADGESLYHVIAELDGLAAHDASRLPTSDRRPLVDRLRAINRQLRAAGRADPHTLYQLDRSFHHAYMETGGTPRLRALYQVIEGHEERYARVYYVMLLPETIKSSVREHEVIIRALARGDSAAAHQAARANWRNSAARLGQTIERLGERGSWWAR
jgi:DNA-binding GntR family transcriptional regulator